MGNGTNSNGILCRRATYKWRAGGKLPAASQTRTGWLCPGLPGGASLSQAPGSAETLESLAKYDPFFYLGWLGRGRTDCVAPASIAPTDSADGCLPSSGMPPL